MHSSTCTSCDCVAATVKNLSMSYPQPKNVQYCQSNLASPSIKLQHYNSLSFVYIISGSYTLNLSGEIR